MSEQLSLDSDQRPLVAPEQLVVTREIVGQMLRFALSGGEPATTQKNSLHYNKLDAELLKIDFTHDAMGGEVCLPDEDPTRLGWLFVNSEPGIGKTGKLAVLTLSEDMSNSFQTDWIFLPDGNVAKMYWEDTPNVENDLPVFERWLDKDEITDVGTIIPRLIHVHSANYND